MKVFTKPTPIAWLLILSMSIFFFSSCEKFNWFQHGGDGHGQKQLQVGNISQLYEAVNDAANTGSLLILAPGTYTLDATYPNAGRLELLQDMELQGQPGHPDQVIIDASLLPAASFNPPLAFPAARTGAIRVGRGSNSIMWLTVLGNASDQALSVIDADLIGTPEPHIRINHCIVKGGRIGIDIRNVGLASVGRILDVELSSNELTENLVQFGQGIEMQNANGATRAVIRASLTGNYVHGNKIGMRAFNNNANNNRTDSGNISIQSTGDRFENNGVGLYLSAALNQAASTTSNGNLLHFEAVGTSVQNNTGTQSPDVTDPAPGGIYAAAGLAANTGTASNNRLEIILSNCLVSGNTGPGIKLYGALSLVSPLAGTNNAADLQLRGLSKQATVIAVPSSPTEAAGTNSIKIH